MDNVNVCVVGDVGVNVAVTERLALIASAQLPVPVQAPVQPVNDQPAGAVAVSVALSVVRNTAVQVAVAGLAHVPPG